jgi:Xaa-Pro aminopeptidase
MGINKVKSDLGFDMVFNGTDFKNFSIDFSKFDKILFENLPLAADDPQDSADLHDLVELFKQKAAIDETINDYDQNFLSSLIAYGNMQNLHYFTDYLQKQINKGVVTVSYSLDKQITVQNILDIRDSAELNAIKEKINSERISTGLYNKCVSALRQVKTTEELTLLKKSVEISSVAHTEVMKAIQTGMSEFALEGIFEYIHKSYGAEEEAYPPIVGAGSSGCHLHYEENTKVNIHNEMVLMDVASAYHGYAADVTRTVPSTGKFTTEQKIIYDLVYKAQEEVFKLCKEGTSFDSTEEKATEVLANGLMQLGIIKSKEEVYTYYPHGCSHFIGLDVHDKGIYDKMLANMAITIEPGIYIPENSACDKKWWNIAVRIEDDILITKNGYELLSRYAPRKSEDVEKMVAQKSVLSDFKLPKISD